MLCQLEHTVGESFAKRPGIREIDIIPTNRRCDRVPVLVPNRDLSKSTRSLFTTTTLGALGPSLGVNSRPEGPEST